MARLPDPLALCENNAFADAFGAVASVRMRDLHEAEETDAPAVEQDPAEDCLEDDEALLVRALVLEDSRSDLLVLRVALDQIPSIRFEITEASRLREAVAALVRTEFDIILTDLGLPDSSGLETLVKVQEVAKGIPVIVMTGMSDERMGIRAMRAGAEDYFFKGRFWEQGLARAIRDAIDRHRVERELRASEARFRDSIESLLDGFALLRPVRNPGGAITDFTAEYTNAAKLGVRLPRGAVAPPTALLDLFPDCHECGLFRELVRIEAGGDPLTPNRIVLPHHSEADPLGPIYDFRAAKTTEGVALSWRDAKPRLVLEAQLLQSEKMSSVGQLAGGIAHDFNNLLTVIHGEADQLRDAVSLPAELVGAVREISAAAIRATNLTKQLLAFSRQQPMIAAEIDLNDAVAQMSNMIGRVLGEDLRLTLEFRQPPPFVRADRGMIEQILLNLAVNARDAMPNGGELEISTSVRWVEESELVLEPDVTPGKFVCLRVRDQGCGIAPHQVEKIFEPFFTTKEVGKGTGLGLATVYGIVKQHKGWIKVESQVGRGTCFEVYLPHSNAKQATPPAILEIVPTVQGHETILLVEDEDTIREMARDFLTVHGYTILEASDGPAALAIWEREGARIDLLLTDLVMPHGLSGQALAAQLQAERPELKVIYSSGYSFDLFGADSLLNAATNFLQKPYRLNGLAKMIRSCLDARAG